MNDSVSKINEEYAADGLRSLDQLLRPDVRMKHLALSGNGQSKALTQADRLASISEFELAANAPDDIRVHFDTARNLYMYAWNVYRFHVVAEQQAIASLEMALRTRFIELGMLDEEGDVFPLVGPLRPKKKARSNRPMLHELLSVAAAEKLVENSRFANRHVWANELAENRFLGEQMMLMHTLGLTEMKITEPAPPPTQADLEHDWIQVYITSLPRTRNTYAHGSRQLHSGVLRTFDVVSDLINQLFGQP